MNRTFLAFAILVLLSVATKAAAAPRSVLVHTEEFAASAVWLEDEPGRDGAEPELLDSSGGCDWLGDTTCNARCSSRTTGSAILVSVSCQPTDNPTQYRCGCTWVLPGPYVPPCYWNCGGSRNAFSPY